MQPRTATVGPTRTRPTGASRATRFTTPVLVAAAVVLLAACGSSDSGSASSSTSSTSTTSADPGRKTSTVVVKTAEHPELGTILVDADGKTLYTLTTGGQAVACTGACLDAWPPLLLPSGSTTATGTPDVKDLGTAPDGTDVQVTQAGLPLYRFAADTAAGDANGEGITSFGGTWNVVKIGGTSSGSTSTTERSNSGY